MVPVEDEREAVSLLVLHVLPSDAVRGAQAYARELRYELDGHPHRHRTLALFDAAPGLLMPDERLDVATGFRRRVGLEPIAILRLRRIVRRLDPNVIVCHGGEALKYAVVARLRGPLVYLKIGTAEDLLRSRLRRSLYRRLVRRVSSVTAVSEAAAREATATLRVPEERVTVIPNGRDASRFARLADPTGVPARLLFVGHMTHTKRPLRFVELVDALRRGGMDVEATMVGDGPLLPQVRPLADSTDIDILGRRGDVPSLMARHDVLVMTSAARGEGMPGVLIEAGLTGLPTVSTDVPGAREVIDQEVTGRLVPVEDFDGLVVATADLVADADRRRRMGQKARARCMDRFTLHSTARQWIALFDGLLTPQTYG